MNFCSPPGVKRTTRPSASRRAHFISYMRSSSAAPSEPARWLRRSLQSRHFLQSGRREVCTFSRSTPNSATNFVPRGVISIAILLDRQQLAADERVEHAHAELAGEMVVAHARAPHRRILRPRPHAQVAGAGGERAEPFEHVGDVAAGEAEIAVAALLLLLDQARLLQL